MDLELKDKVVLVTGSSRGIGRETALAFAREGARTIVNYHRDQAGASAAVEEIKAIGGQALALQSDVSDRESMGALVDEVVGRWGSIDILINNAVAFGDAELPLKDLTPDKWDRMLAVSLTGAFNCVSLCAPLMCERGWGRIVNISSHIALVGYPKMAHYSAAKAGLIGLTKSLAKELGPDGILVNTVAPQLVMTETMKASLSPQVQESLAKRNPLRRLSVPDDIVRVILFLASGWNTFVNGEVITVSGGV